MTDATITVTNLGDQGVRAVFGMIDSMDFLNFLIAFGERTGV
jgi:hypothetical protein